MNTRNAKILVVDDERLNRLLLCTNLQESGYRVETAEDGKQALRMLRAEPFDAVLLDLVMPNMDGYQALAEIKGDEVLRRIPVIVISSTDEMESIVRCIEMVLSITWLSPLTLCCYTPGSTHPWPPSTRNGWPSCANSLPR
jgi:CheY-like chemotaxis protein